MPKNADFQKIYDKFIADYGEKEGKNRYYAWLNKHKYDDTKPFPKKVNKMKLKLKGKIQFEKLNNSPRIIAGRASSPVIDGDGDLITKEALEDMFTKFINSDYAILGTMHKGIPLGKVLPEYIDSDGVKHVSNVDDEGLYIVGQIREDIKAADELWRDIVFGKLESFSMGMGVLKEPQIINKGYRSYNQYDKGTVELHEISTVDNPSNPGGRGFTMLKMSAEEPVQVTTLEPEYEKGLINKITSSISDTYNKLVGGDNNLSDEKKDTQKKDIQPSPQEIIDEKEPSTEPLPVTATAPPAEPPAPTAPTLAPVPATVASTQAPATTPATPETPEKDDVNAKMDMIISKLDQLNNHSKRLEALELKNKEEAKHVEAPAKTPIPEGTIETRAVNPEDKPMTTAELTNAIKDARKKGELSLAQIIEAAYKGKPFPTK